MIVNENNVRANQVGSRPLYLFFDQIYSDLSVDGSFVHPLTLCPEIRNYLICVDGISKSLCATGIRVGWAFGPQDIMGKMTEVFSHIGAWAPKPEQNAVARYLNDYEDMTGFVTMKTKQWAKMLRIVNLMNILKMTNSEVHITNLLIILIILQIQPGM